MNNEMRKRYRLVTLILALGLALGCFITYTPMICAQQNTHTVEKGDTLWDICEKYYGDPGLWPKLWQMNPFVTNPHLLNVGDVINLLEIEPIKPIVEASREVKEIPITVKKTAEAETEPEPTMKGVDVSDLTDIRAIGYLSREKITPWGRLFSSESGKLMFSKGETIFVLFDEAKAVKPGDEFVICHSSPLLKHPLTGKKLGYTLAMHGRLVIEEPSGFKFKKGQSKAEVIEVYRPVHIDDKVMPYDSVSGCVKPVAMKKQLVGHIVASKQQRELIGVNSIVYLDQGLKQGVQRGNLFEVFKKNIVPDPEDKNPFVRKKITLPDIVIGTLIVLESRPDTSAALVLSATENIQNGGYIRVISWDRKNEILSMMQSCDVE